MMARIIMHIDLNAFFATAEQIRSPELINQPLVVAGVGRRGIVLTASYEARKYGIHAAMPTYMALRLYPQLKIVKPDFRWYSELSHRFIAYLRHYSSMIEVASIDECFVDMTLAMKDIKDPEAYLKHLQNGLLESTLLKSSIGLSPTKFLAKMASDMKKPMGITILRRKDIETKLWPLPIKDMFGIGKKTYPMLEKMGIRTIGDLANNESEAVKHVLGKFYYVLQDWAHGKGDDVVQTEESSPKSIGNSSTFHDDTDNYEEIKTMFKELSQEVSERAIRDGVVGSTVQIVIKNADFSTINRSKTIAEPIQDFPSLFRYALELFDKNYKGQMIRLVGVTLQNLMDKHDIAVQMSLFDYEKHEEASEVKLLINELNRKLKKPLLRRASEKYDKK